MKAKQHPENDLLLQSFLYAYVGWDSLKTKHKLSLSSKWKIKKTFTPALTVLLFRNSAVVTLLHCHFCMYLSEGKSNDTVNTNDAGMRVEPSNVVNRWWQWQQILLVYAYCKLNVRWPQKTPLIKLVYLKTSCFLPPRLYYIVSGYSEINHRANSTKWAKD